MIFVCRPQYCSLKDLDACGILRRASGGGAAGTNTKMTDLAFQTPWNLTTTARHHPLFQDFRQHCVMECFSLLRGE